MHWKDAAFLHGADERTTLGLKTCSQALSGQKGSKSRPGSETFDLVGSKRWKRLGAKETGAGLDEIEHEWPVRHRVRGPGGEVEV